MMGEGASLPEAMDGPGIGRASGRVRVPELGQEEMAARVVEAASVVRRGVLAAAGGTGRASNGGSGTNAGGDCAAGRNGGQEEGSHCHDGRVRRCSGVRNDKRG